jgi:hypothetical protein
LYVFFGVAFLVAIGVGCSAWRPHRWRHENDRHRL